MRFFKYVFIIMFLLLTHSFAQDLNNWEYCGIDSVSITAMHSFGNGRLVAGSNGDSRVIYGSHDYGKTWDTISMLLPHSEVRRFEFINNTLYACLIGNSWSTYMSKDSGKTWEKVPGGPLIGNSFCMDGKDSILIAGGFNKYARSTDSGETWETLYLCDFFADLDDNEVGAMLSMVRFRDTLYVGTQCGVFATWDWGLSWEKRGKNSSGAGSAEVSSIDFLDTTIMIGTKNGVYFSYSFGGTGLTDWKWIFHNESGISELYNVDDSLLLFYNSHGSVCDLFWSDDTGKTWERYFLMDSINAISVTGFCSDDKYQYTHSYYGVWKYPRFDNVNIKNNIHQSVEKKSYTVNLIGNTLTISINQKSNVTVNIYTLSGKKINAFSKELREKGKYAYNLLNYSNNILNGIYILNININGDSISKKINYMNQSRCGVQ